MCLPGGVVLAQAVPATGGAPAAVSPAVRTLDIWEFVVDGNSVLDELQVSRLLEPFLGPERSTEDVDAARKALEDAYHEQGYKTVAVSVPRQTVRGGVVMLQVVEGRVRKLNVVGSRYHSLDRIREQAPSLSEGQVLDFDEVKRDITALNQQADRRVSPALRAGETPGVVDVDLVVSDDLPLHGTAELNNRHSNGTTQLRSLATLSYDNLWQRGHSVSLSYQTAPQRRDDAQVIFGSYLARFEGSNFSLLFNALRSDSDVATVGSINVIGKGRSFGLRGVWSLPVDERFYQNVSLGLDAKRYRTQVSIKGQGFETPLSYYPFSFAYSGMLRMEQSQLQADASVSFASLRLGSDLQELQSSRSFTRSQQLALRTGLSYTRQLPAQTELMLRLNTQMTDQPLVTNEQLSAGGADTVRGYFESEALGDYGAVYGLELRSPNFGRGWVDQLQLFAFGDGAHLRLRRPTADVDTSTTLASAGLGLNLQLLSHLHATADWANVLTGAAFSRRADSRYLFRVWGSF